MWRKNANRWVDYRELVDLLDQPSLWKLDCVGTK